VPSDGGVTRGVRGAERLPGSPNPRQTIIRTCRKISF